MIKETGSRVQSTSEVTASWDLSKCKWHAAVHLPRIYLQGNAQGLRHQAYTMPKSKWHWSLLILMPMANPGTTSTHHKMLHCGYPACTVPAAASSSGFEPWNSRRLLFGSQATTHTSRTWRRHQFVFYWLFSLCLGVCFARNTNKLKAWATASLAIPFQTSAIKPH